MNTSCRGGAVHLYLCYNVHKPRSILKQLQPMAPHMQNVYAKIKVKAEKEGALYAKYTQELTEMIGKLDNFLLQCSIGICEADEISSDSPDDEDMEALKNKLEAMVSNAEHHLAGVKGTKTKFSNL